MRVRWIAMLAVLALAAVACDGSPSASGDESTAPETSAPETSAPAEGSPTPEETEGANGSPAAGEMISVFDIEEGDCLNIPEDVTEGQTVERIDCAVAHDYEVYALFDMAGGDAYPGDEAVRAAAEDECPTRFETFVGMSYEESELYVYYLRPSADTWADGDREIVCTLYLPDEHLIGSMEGSAR